MPHKDMWYMQNQKSRKESKMKVLLNIIKFIIITVLVICSIAMGILNIVSSTILEKEYIISKLEETNFYEETYELVKSNLSKISLF